MVWYVLCYVGCLLSFCFVDFWVGICVSVFDVAIGCWMWLLICLFLLWLVFSWCFGLVLGFVVVVGVSDYFGGLVCVCCFGCVGLLGLCRCCCFVYLVFYFDSLPVSFALVDVSFACWLCLRWFWYLCCYFCVFVLYFDLFVVLIVGLFCWFVLLAWCWIFIVSKDFVCLFVMFVFFVCLFWW